MYCLCTILPLRLSNDASWNKTGIETILPVSDIFMQSVMILKENGEHKTLYNNFSPKLFCEMVSLWNFAET